MVDHGCRPRAVLESSLPPSAPVSRRAGSKLPSVFLSADQYLTDNPVADVDAIMAANPALAEDEMAGWVVEELHEHGSFPVY
jgi:hypothetical protein